MIAALYVQTDGVYADIPDVELWDEARDARLYTGPHPVVAHPPCQRWGEGEQRLDPVMLEHHGYEYARRKGRVSMVGGKHKTKIRNATPPEFRDVLIAMARTVQR